MSFTVELKDTASKIEIETDKPLAALADQVRAFAAAMNILNAAVPLASFLGARTMNPLIYSYTFTTIDGRTWAQALDFQDGVKMTFNVPVGWRLEEFVPHRAVRDQFVLMVRDFDLVKVAVTYGAN